MLLADYDARWDRATALCCIRHVKRGKQKSWRNKAWYSHLSSFVFFSFGVFFMWPFPTRGIERNHQYWSCVNSQKQKKFCSLILNHFAPQCKKPELPCCTWMTYLGPRLQGSIQKFNLEVVCQVIVAAAELGMTGSRQQSWQSPPWEELWFRISACVSGSLVI